MDQAKLIHDYNDKFRPKFNKDLFIRHDDDIINSLKNVIYSIERDSVFTIKVIGFEIIENYDDINHILWAYEDSILNKVKKDKEPEEKKKTKTTAKKNKKDNQFEYINLKDSDIKIIKVTYFIQIEEKKDGLVNDTIVVYIAIPRIVDKFYFRINGNVYSAMYQIVDASTYNNSAAKSAKKQSVTLKTLYMPIRVYRYNKSLKDIDGNAIKCTYFLANMFKKSILLMKYHLAKFGYYNTLSFFNIPSIKILPYAEKDNIDKDNEYIFPVRKDMIITINKYIYDNEQIAQSLVYTIHSVLTYMKDTKYSDVFSNSVWLRSLGSEFTSKDADTILTKSRSILDSLEFIYDNATMEDLQLNMYDKCDVYSILRWMMYEFNYLRSKDNLDISTKKVRYADYIAALYANRLANGIYRLSDKGNKADLNTIKKAIQIPPMFLLNAITKCQLVNYKNCVNDLDSLIALKYTYKGDSGIGEKSNAIPNAYRNVHPSHLGRVDIDSSSNSDPGVSGTLCPLSKLHNLHFKDFNEQSIWIEQLNETIQNYRSMTNKQEIVKLIKDNNLSKKQDNNNVLNECVTINKSLLAHTLFVNNNIDFINGYDLFGDGLIFIENI